MDERFWQFQKSVEDWHWWYAVRWRILDQILAAREPTGSHTPLLLDVGSGTGGAAPTLARHGHAVALDREPSAFTLAPDRPYHYRVVGAADQPLPFADNSFDVVCALDVLEHLDDDDACVAELYRICRPGGTVVVFVPALQILWGYNDDYSQHRRRYRRPELRALLRSAGFVEEVCGYFNLTLFLPTLVARLAQRALPTLLSQSEHSTRPTPLNTVLRQLFALELPVLKHTPLPLGTSVYFVGRKPA